MAMWPFIKILCPLVFYSCHTIIIMITVNCCLFPSLHMRQALNWTILNQETDSDIQINIKLILLFFTRRSAQSTLLQLTCTQYIQSVTSQSRAHLAAKYVNNQAISEVTLSLPAANTKWLAMWEIIPLSIITLKCHTTTAHSTQYTVQHENTTVNHLHRKCAIKNHKTTVIRSLVRYCGVAGRGPAYSRPQCGDLVVVQCARTGRGGELVGVC